MLVRQHKAGKVMLFGNTVLPDVIKDLERRSF